LKEELCLWVLSLNDETVQVLDFHRIALADTQWRFSEYNDLYVRYHRPGQTLTIANKQQSGGDRLIISMTTKP